MSELLTTNLPIDASEQDMLTLLISHKERLAHVSELGLGEIQKQALLRGHMRRIRRFLEDDEAFAFVQGGTLYSGLTAYRFREFPPIDSAVLVRHEKELNRVYAGESSIADMLQSGLDAASNNPVLISVLGRGLRDIVSVDNIPIGLAAAGRLETLIQDTIANQSLDELEMSEDFTDLRAQFTNAFES